MTLDKALDGPSILVEVDIAFSANTSIAQSERALHSYSLLAMSLRIRMTSTHEVRQAGRQANQLAWLSSVKAWKVYMTNWGISL